MFIKYLLDEHNFCYTVYLFCLYTLTCVFNGIKQPKKRKIPFQSVTTKQTVCLSFHLICECKWDTNKVKIQRYMEGPIFYLVFHFLFLYPQDEQHEQMFGLP